MGVIKKGELYEFFKIAVRRFRQPFINYFY